jgi:hypothetical protein
MDSVTSPGLATLERRIQWLTAVCVFLGLGLVLETAYHFLPGQPEIAAQRFLLTDTHGRVRGLFGQWGDGTPVLQLNGSDGRERVILLASPDGSSGLRILDSTRAHRVYLETGTDGWPSLVFDGSDGTSRLRLATGPGVPGRVQRFDEHGAELKEH